jgi:hypothetical protein
MSEVANEKAAIQNVATAIVRAAMETESQERRASLLTALNHVLAASHMVAPEPKVRRGRPPKAEGEPVRRRRRKGENGGIPTAPQGSDPNATRQSELDQVTNAA